MYLKTGLSVTFLQCDVIEVAVFPELLRSCVIVLLAEVKTLHLADLEFYLTT